MAGKPRTTLMNPRTITVRPNLKNHSLFKGFNKDSKMMFDDNIVLRVFIEYYAYFTEQMILDFLSVLQNHS